MYKKNKKKIKEHNQNQRREGERERIINEWTNRFLSSRLVQNPQQVLVCVVVDSVPQEPTLPFLSLPSVLIHHNFTIQISYTYTTSSIWSILLNFSLYKQTNKFSFSQTKFWLFSLSRLPVMAVAQWQCKKRGREFSSGR